MLNIHFTRPIAKYAVKTLALVDYDIATRVSDAVAEVSSWGYDHNLPIIAKYSVSGLQQLDYVGSFLISIVAWIIQNTY